MSLMFASTAVQQSFVDAPMNTTVVQGQTVILHCSVANRKGAVQWKKGELLLGQFHVAQYDYHLTTVDLLGPFHGAIAVPSVTRCRCRRRRRRGHQCAGGVRRDSSDTW